MPRLSIITINRNNLAGLRKTVESVLCQTYREFEYIIIDGASTDGSAEYVLGLQSPVTRNQSPVTTNHSPVTSNQ